MEKIWIQALHYIIVDLFALACQTLRKFFIACHFVSNVRHEGAEKFLYSSEVRLTLLTEFRQSVDFPHGVEEFLD